MLSAHPDRPSGSEERWAAAAELLEALQELEDSLTQVNVRTEAASSAKKQKAAYKRWVDHAEVEVRDLGPLVAGEDAPSAAAVLSMHVDDYVELTDAPVSRLVTSKQVLTCSPCAGTGREKWVKGMDVPECEMCDGEGGQYKSGAKTGGHESWSATITPCQVCDGRGHRSLGAAGRCALCEGTGLYREAADVKVWTVKLARGVEEGKPLPQETPGLETFLCLNAEHPYDLESPTTERRQGAYWRSMYDRVSVTQDAEGLVKLTFYLTAVRGEAPILRVPGKAPLQRWVRGGMPDHTEMCRESTYCLSTSGAGGRVVLVYRVKWVTGLLDMHGMATMHDLLHGLSQTLGCETMVLPEPEATEK